LKPLEKRDLLVPVCHLANNLKQNITEQMGLNRHLVFSSFSWRNYTWNGNCHAADESHIWKYAHPLFYGLIMAILEKTNDHFSKRKLGIAGCNNMGKHSV